MSDVKLASVPLALLAIVGAAAAQEPQDPTVNDSDFNTSTPSDDEAYLDEAEAETSGDPTLSDSDFDTSIPTGDEAYLDEQAAGGDAPSAGARNGTPGPAAWLVLATLAAAAGARRVRR